MRLVAQCMSQNMCPLSDRGQGAKHMGWGPISLSSTQSCISSMTSEKLLKSSVSCYQY